MLTLCMNPSFDRTLTVESLQIGAVNRIREVQVDAGGKGLNVAAVAALLGREATCLCVLGQENGAAFQALLPSREHLRMAWFPTGGAVRTNTKLRSLDGAPMTELNEPGIQLTEAALEQLADRLEELAAGQDTVVLTGSLSAGCPPEYLCRLIRQLGAARCAVDASGAALRSAWQEKPCLIKPNREELEELVGALLPTRREILDAVRPMLQEGPTYALVSLGGEGALLCTRETCWQADALRVSVSSTVGAGDAMLAAALSALSLGPEEMLRRGTAAGAASVMTSGTGLIDPTVYAELLPQVQVREVTA